MSCVFDSLRSLQERSEEQYRELQDLKEKNNSLLVQQQAQNEVHSSEK